VGPKISIEGERFSFHHIIDLLVHVSHWMQSGRNPVVHRLFENYDFI